MLGVNVSKVVGLVSLLLRERPSLGSALAPTPRCSLRYLRRQGARTRLIREDPHHPRSPLHLPKEPLQHVRRAYPGVVRSWVGKVGKGVPYARLEDRDRLREAPTVKLGELLGQSPRS